MWRCSNCGDSVASHAPVCGSCGAAREEEESNSGSQASRPAGIGEQRSVGPVPNHADSKQASASGGGMNRRQIAVLVCKSVALLMFIQAAFFSAEGIVQVVFMSLDVLFHGGHLGDDFFHSLMFSSPMFAALTVGVVCWMKSTQIASQMVAADPVPVTSRSLAVQDVMIVLFSTAGVLILVGSVLDMIWIVSNPWRHDFRASTFWYSSETWSVLVQLALAFCLLFGWRGMVQAVRWLRDAGTTTRDDELGEDDKGMKTRES